MSDILNLVNDAIFVSLVNTTLQITLLIPVIALIIWMFRIKSATTRYSLWLFVLFAMLLLPLLNPFVSHMDFARFRHQGATGGGLDDMMRLRMGASDVGELSEADAPGLSTSAAKADANSEADVSLVNPVSVAYFIWCAGALSMFCITIGVYRKLGKLKIDSSDVESQAALEVLSRLKNKLGIRRTVALKTSPEVYIPMSMGIFSPVIIVPDSAIDDGASDELEMILTHELAHIKRCDYLTRFLQNMLKVVFFFHPLFHLMKRKLAKEREHICDDWVIDITNRRSKYAECLVNLLEMAVHKPISVPVTLAMAERKRDIPGRIDMIVDRRRRTATRVSRRALFAVLIIGCVSLPVIGGLELLELAGAKPASHGQGTALARAQAPRQAQIVFQSYRDGNNEIYVMDADGKNQRRLTNSPGDDWGPAWSPDSQKIVFYSKRDGNWDIYVMDVDGKNQRRLTNSPGDDWGPAWSPDGQTIAFQSKRDGNFEIYVMDVDGKNQHKLTNNPAYDAEPTWSPDGLGIAFLSNRDGNFGIYVMDADGKNQHNLTDLPGGVGGYPAWSPDGQTIAFQSRPDGKGTPAEVYVMDADGGNLRNLTDNPAEDGGSTWSPDSQRIAFHSNRGGNWEIYVMDADGKNLRRLTNNPADDGEPAWFDPAFVSVSPAGKLKSTWGEIKLSLISR
ncbi:M56 family metallopeptidase [Candidatus Poribacteria bacterium]